MAMTGHKWAGPVKISELIIGKQLTHILDQQKSAFFFHYYLITPSEDFWNEYDLISRNYLWLKIINFGINGKQLALIRLMYFGKNLKVKHMSAKSTWTHLKVGDVVYFRSTATETPAGVDDRVPDAVTEHPSATFFTRTPRSTGRGW